MKQHCLHISRGCEWVLSAAGVDAETVFSDARIRVWRKLPDRENCTLDTTRPDGSPLRLHIKRYPSAGTSPARQEAAGLRLLEATGIPTAPLVAWGALEDGRSFIILEDLAGFRPADRMIEEISPHGQDACAAIFDALLIPTADLTAKLHDCGLHHRDLYLCHFFAKPGGGDVDVRLIDAARVKRLPCWPFRNRWIVKDLAQFWYSALRLGVDEPSRMRWLERYAEQRGISANAWRRSIERKSAWIARHDEKLNQRQPARNVSIPG